MTTDRFLKILAANLMVDGLVNGGESTQSDSKAGGNGRTSRVSASDETGGKPGPGPNNPKLPSRWSGLQIGRQKNKGWKPSRSQSLSRGRRDSSRVRSQPGTSSGLSGTGGRIAAKHPRPFLDKLEYKQLMKDKEQRSIQLMKEQIDELEARLANGGSDSRLTPADFRPIEDHLIGIVLNWATEWLRRKEFARYPPPGVSGGWQLQRPATDYQTAFDYYRTFLPLLLNEMWSNLYEECNLRSLQKGTRKKLPVITITKSGSDRMTCHLNYDQDTVCCIKCLRGKLEQEVDLPQQGSLIRTLCREGADQKDFFGYITSFGPLHKKKHVVELTIQFHPRHSGLVSRLSDRKAFIRIEPLSYMTPFLRHLSSIVQIVCNPLFKPVKEDLKWDFSSFDPKLKRILSSVIGSENTYNEDQKKAIIGCLNMALDPDVKRNMIRLIQGPPGTGKTHTLMAIIKGLYLAAKDKKIFQNQDVSIGGLDHSFKALSINTVSLPDKDDSKKWPRLLICAPSHEAVDVITRRLIQTKPELYQLTDGDLDLSFIRFGPAEKVNSDIVPFTLNAQAEAAILKNLDGLIKNLQENYKLNEDESDLKKITEDLLQEMKMGSSDEKNLMTIRRYVKNQDYHGDGKLRVVARILRRKYADKTIEGCHIILSTLNSTHDDRIGENMPARPGSGETEEEKITFDYLIVDEACQCTEPESLMPLHYYKIRRAILIGDPLQLPATVLSNIAERYGFQQSLFERLFNNFKSKFNQGGDWSDTFVMLSTQYRMHAEIVSYPSRAFYDGRLRTWKGLDRNSPLVPSLIFDLDSRERRTAESLSTENRMEADFVISLLLLICELVEKNADSLKMIRTVGIITPYKGHRQLLERKMAQLSCMKTTQLKVDINTVDGFQGQERDIIILSCVRATEEEESDDYTPVCSPSQQVSSFAASSQRLNVALTRARYANFVIINGTKGKLTQAKLWKDLLRDAKNRGALKPVTSSMDQTDLKNLILR